MSREKELYNEDGMKITVTRDPELVNHHNIGYCAIPFQQIKGRTIKDIYYENVYFDREGEWELDNTFVVIALEEVDYSPINSMVVQQDPEGNPGGYLMLTTPDGPYRNKTEGDKLRARA